MKPTDVFLGEFDAARQRGVVVTPDLGDAEVSKNVAALLEQMAARCPRQFLLTWTGSKVPHDVAILGHTIAWTQHGQVVSSKGVTIGVYERLMEFGGPNRDKHRMIIGLFTESCEVTS